jgi:Cys-tRNA(Pro)/Cys-tRNA(Cys) deacylase
VWHGSNNKQIRSGIPRDLYGERMKTPATALLDARRISYRLHSYPHQTGQAYGPEAAAALGLDPARVFKTLVAEVDGALTVGVLPVTGSLDLKALAASVGGKRAKMAELTSAERATGYVAGGISPLGQRKRLPTVLDVSATSFETMFCSAGRRGLEVEIAPADLVALTQATVAAIATG